LMLTLVMSTTLSNGIGSTDNFPASTYAYLFISNFIYSVMHFIRTRMLERMLVSHNI